MNWLIDDLSLRRSLRRMQEGIPRDSFFVA